MSSIKVCKTCGGTRFKVVLNQGAIIETVSPDVDPKGYIVHQAGEKIMIGKFLKCMSCETETPEVIEKAMSVPCPSCGNPVEESELQSNNGTCLVCAAKNQMPQLQNMSQDQLIRLLVQSQMKQQTQAFSGPTPSASEDHAHAASVTPAAVTEVHVHTAPVGGETSAPAETPVYTLDQFNAAVAEMKEHMATYDATWTSQKKGGFTRKLNTMVQAINPMADALIATGHVIEDHKLVFANFQASLTTVDAVETPDESIVTPDAPVVTEQPVVQPNAPGPFDVTPSDDMMIQPAYDGDPIIPLVTPMADAGTMMPGGNDPLSTPLAPPAFMAPTFDPGDEDAPY